MIETVTTHVKKLQRDTWSTYKVIANNLSKYASKQDDSEHILTNAKVPGKYKIPDFSAMSSPNSMIFL